VPHRLLLVPGFFGFTGTGNFGYFVHVRDLLAEFGPPVGLDGEIRLVRTEPTASLRRRAAHVAESIADLLLGQQILKLLSISTIYSLGAGRLPVRAVLRMVGLIRRPSAKPQGVVAAIASPQSWLAVWADHLDVIGHFHHPRHVPPHFDWLASGSGFTRPQFELLWKKIATWLGAGAA
jgi:hypothetical protein